MLVTARRTTALVKCRHDRVGDRVVTAHPARNHRSGAALLQACRTSVSTGGRRASDAIHPTPAGCVQHQADATRAPTFHSTPVAALLPTRRFRVTLVPPGPGAEVPAGSGLGFDPHLAVPVMMVGPAQRKVAVIAAVEPIAAVATPAVLIAAVSARESQTRRRPDADEHQIRWRHLLRIRLCLAALRGGRASCCSVSALSPRSAGAGRPPVPPNCCSPAAPCSRCWRRSCWVWPTARRRSNGLASIDPPVWQWMIDHRTPALTSVGHLRHQHRQHGLDDASSPSRPSLSLLIKRRRGDAALVAVVAAGAGLLVRFGKATVGRERPPVEFRLVTETNESFPSGHALASAAILGVVLVVFCRRSGAARPGSR